ncbi:MAG: acyl-CoA dehydrogenase [Flavobacteriales bacterium TMED96]|nr:MAG: acyl-CoA dehydrogenase [Flavobacteriales bacterium TMED96]
MKTIYEKTVKGSEFIIKELTPEKTFTPEDFSEEQILMKDSVKEFVDREIIAERSRFENKDYEYTKEVMKKAGQLGFLSVGVPEEYGGMGMSFTSTMLVCEYISGANGSFSTAFGAHTGIGTMPIVLYGNEDQKSKYVPKLASGEWFGSYCLTEPGAGSDANSGKTLAKLSDDKKYYLISGQKIWISNAGFANLFIVFARIGDDKNITAFIVPVDLKNGITLGEEEEKLGIRASSTRQVFFNDTKVPVQNILGKRGEGFKIAINSLNVGRIKLAAATIEGQRYVTSLAVQYANQRVQFKSPISSFGAIQSKIASMATYCFATESATYRAASDIENRINQLKNNGTSSQESELKGFEDFAVECSILKVAGSDNGQICADHGIQIFGGMGYSCDSPMEMAWRDSRIARIYEGTNEINKMLSIAMLLKKASKGEIDLITNSNEILNQIRKDVNIYDFNFSQEKSLNQEQHLIENLKKVFLILINLSFQKYGTKLEYQQQVLMNMADILIDIYLAESVYLRVSKNLKKLDEEKKIVQESVVKLYTYESTQRAISSFKEVVLNITKSDDHKDMIEIVNNLLSYVDNPDVIELRRIIAKHVIQKNEYPF